ncbi:MAG TPA: HlyD family efflux transporter periplasmic adaptor subunit [Nocardioides sp.]|nr:HlyD family efflux transporter periplasmic adaptor subunit [Nocardioides sp.]
MTWGNRLRLLAGVIVILALCGVLTLVVNQRERQAFSANAAVAAVQYQVGSDYGGIMVDQLVEPGAEVKEGQELFTVSSFSLQKDLANGLDPLSTAAYHVDPDTGLVTYLAAAGGTLEEIGTRQGGYVPGGESIAVITQDDTQFVQAQFQLRPVDYARIELGGEATVELPNRTTLPGTISDISVKTADGIAYTTVRIDVSELRSETYADFAKPGSPVSVTLTLQDDGVLAGPTDSLMGFLHRVGVR